MSAMLMFLGLWVGAGFVFTWLLAVVLSAVTGIVRGRIARAVALIPSGLALVLIGAMHWADDDRDSGMMFMFALLLAIAAAGGWLATVLLFKQKPRTLEDAGPGLSAADLT